MTASSTTTEGRCSYTVVLRCAQSQIRIPTGGGILLSPVASPYGNYEVRISTRTDNPPGIAVPVPRELCIEVTGAAPSLEVALNVSAATANEYVRQIAFVANAWHGLLDIHLAYDSTVGCKERIYFQNWVNEERGLPRAARSIDQHLIFRVLAGITQIPPKDRSRVIRSTTQYSDALQYWKPGSELYALAHLYMGVEGITEVVVRREIAKRKLKGKAELAKQVMDPTKRPFSLRVADWVYRRKTGNVPPVPLDNWVRREIIFKGDKETFTTARDASNKLEHGLAQHEDVHQLAVRCVAKCAEYLREAILDLIPMSDSDRAILCAPPYASPANTRGYDRQVLGVIRCEDDDVAAPDQAYPYVRWEVGMSDFQTACDGKYKMRVEQRLTPVLSEGARLEVSRIHFAGPSETVHEDISVSVEKHGRHFSVAGVEVGINSPSDSRWVGPVGSFILNCNSVRHLSRYWILRLTGNAVETLSFSESVEKIRVLLAGTDITDELKSECVSAWQKAIQFDELRAALADSACQPGGLMPVSLWSRNHAPLMSELEKLNEANAELVSLARRLVSLLDVLPQPPLSGGAA